MKTKQTLQSEALQRLETQLNRWKDIHSDPLGPSFNISWKDYKFIFPFTHPTMCPPDKIKALADRKVKALTRDITNLKRKLGKE